MKAENKHYFYFGLFFLWIGILLSLYFYHFNGSFSAKHEEWAFFGDYVSGVIGTVTSTAALFLVFVTYRAQKTEFDNSRSARLRMTDITQNAAIISGLSPQIDRCNAEIQTLENSLEIEGARFEKEFEVTGIIADIEAGKISKYSGTDHSKTERDVFEENLVCIHSRLKKVEKQRAELQELIDICLKSLSRTGN